MHKDEPPPKDSSEFSVGKQVYVFEVAGKSDENPIVISRGEHEILKLKANKAMVRSIDKPWHQGKWIPKQWMRFDSKIPDISAIIASSSAQVKQDQAVQSVDLRCIAGKATTMSSQQDIPTPKNMNDSQPTTVPNKPVPFREECNVSLEGEEVNMEGHLDKQAFELPQTEKFQDEHPHWNESEWISRMQVRPTSARNQSNEQLRPTQRIKSRVRWSSREWTQPDHQSRLNFPERQFERIGLDQIEPKLNIRPRTSLKSRLCSEGQRGPPMVDKTTLNGQVAGGTALVMEGRSTIGKSGFDRLL